ncbi:stimulated by retinoic acid gene 8 protein homolog isoform X1 [Pleurodeles waltl]|uniref:stimulated by retinoic acid gene 8 protein homolog isoform X1 n=1 Tax=Pleurodeles waltl TaxID=8319 RepID=UPI003709765B
MSAYRDNASSSSFSRVAADFNPHLLQSSVARRRLSQARQRATLASLIGQLRDTVYPEMDPYNMVTKGQVLRRAKNYIQELEHTLDTLLKMKESFHLEDGNPCSLEEVKEEYVRVYCCNASSASVESSRENLSMSRYFNKQYENKSMEEESKIELSQSSVTSSPDLMEFERYLYFYKQTVDLLVENQIVPAGDVTLPVVSKAVSHLWQDLPEDRKASILQYCVRQEKIPWPQNLPIHEPVCSDGSVRSSQADSQEASGSLLSSPPEEILFEDAFDLAAGFLDHNEMRGLSSTSPVYDDGTLENPEQNGCLYRQIVSFLTGHLQAIPQDTGLQIDYETVMLRCTETFDDEDL